jgi:antitoxin ParD1/3/4
MARLDVTLPEELKAFIDAEAAGGGYTNPSDYVRDVLLTIWRHKTNSALEAELVRRINGPPAIEVTPQFWEDLKERVRRRAAAGSRS